MKRLLLSLCGGILIPFSLAALRTKMDDWERLGEFLREALWWPLILWKRLTKPDCDFCLPLDGLIVSVIYNVLLFSLLTYAFLRLRERRRRAGLRPPLP